MDGKDYTFIKPANWTKEEEKLLHDYVLANGIAENCIDWSKINQVFPRRTLAQCSSKLFRMRQETDKFNFKREIRKLRKLHVDANKKHIFPQKLSIEILINVLKEMAAQEPLI